MPEISPTSAFEALVEDLSARFAAAGHDAIDAEIEGALRGIVLGLGTDRASFAEFTAEGDELVLTHIWARPEPGIEQTLPRPVRMLVPLLHDRLQQGETVEIGRLEELPAEATAEREYLARVGIKSLVAVPLALGGRFVCALSTSTFRATRDWSEQDKKRLRTLGQVMANAHYRARAERRLRAAHDFTSAILGSVDSLLAVLDQQGQIAAVNPAWQRAAEQGLAGLERGAREGAGYLACWRFGPSEVAERVAQGIASVLAGRSQRFVLEYDTGTTATQDFLLRVTPFQSAEGGAVVSIVDVSELSRVRTGLANSLAEVQHLKQRLEAENVYLREEVQGAHGFEEVVGRGPALREVLSQVQLVAPTGSAVLLTGETGVGKELMALAVHARSPRRAGPFIRVNCATLPPTLIESELFGHEKGAFTGALGQKLGRFEVADGGTLLLDEIGELGLEMQPKLLRILQTGEFERVGSTRTLRADVRIIAATNRDLEAAIAEGRFRADLFYRLSVFPIHVPPLRERREDVPLLVWSFIHARQAALGRRIERVDGSAMAALQSYSWPGNIRELQNVVERALILSTGDTLRLEGAFGGAGKSQAGAVAAGDLLEDQERAHIRRVLEACGWRINGLGNAADRLGLHPSTLRFRIKKLGIELPEGRPNPVRRARREKRTLKARGAAGMANG